MNCVRSRISAKLEFDYISHARGRKTYQIAKSTTTISLLSRLTRR
jgi:hypothetical protein